MDRNQVLVIGTGFAGSVMARKFAEAGKKVLMLEKRSHIGGNMYDKKDSNGILVHQYGPHIAHFKDWRTYEYLSNFTEFVPYQHHVRAIIDGKEVPLPFNLNTIDSLFDIVKSAKIKECLIEEFGLGKKVPILELRKSPSKDIRELAEFVYEKVFYHYTKKMWGKSPEEMDPAVTGRVPVSISYDDRYFTDPIQVMPKYGYTKLFRKLLKHSNIRIKLNEDANKRLVLKDGKIYLDGKIFDGIVIYTGAIDSLFNYKLGHLPYRSLYFKHKTYRVGRLQTSAVLNWPDDRLSTRRTENKLLTCQPDVPNVTSTIVEYPGPYDEKDTKWSEPYYPIITEENNALYSKYLEESKKYPKLVLIGRLAEYKYYDMEPIILAALDKFEEIKDLR